MNPPVEPFGQFKLVHEVAVGGMGEILLASDTQLSRPVAIKRVLEKFRTRPDVARMFEVEATIMSVLRHPNIVRVFESGEIEGVFYISMEYIHGKTLRQLVDRSREVGEALPPALVIEAVSKLARALSYAHGMTGRSGSPMGLVHRDVNPSNLLLGYDGSVKLIDFGIVQTDDELAPEDLEPKGKFAYMSPEQTRGERVDRRSDLFSLGICLYEALTLYNPFIHESKGGNAVEAIQSREPSPVSERNHRLSPFDPILSKLLAKNPDERFQDGADLADALDELGGSFKSFMPLAAFMTDLFESQKAQEDAMLETVALQSSSTILVSGSAPPITAAPPPLPSNTESENEGSAPPLPLHDDEDTGLAEPELEIAPAKGSTLAFGMIALLIIAATAAGAYTVYTQILKHRIETTARVQPQPRARRVPAEPMPIRAPDPEPQADVGSPEPLGETAPNPAPEGPGDAPDVEAPRPIANDEPNPGERKNRRKAPSTKPQVTEDASPSEPPKPAAKAKKPLASLNVLTDPEVRLSAGDERFTGSVDLYEPSGTLRIGRGRNATSDPFAVELRYAIKADRLELSVRSEPWAIVRVSGGPTLGRTPATYRARSGSTSFELSNPRERRLMRVILRYRPKRQS